MKPPTQYHESISKVELRDRLEEILDKVKSGYSILITDNDHLLAEMIPIQKADDTLTSADATFLESKEEFFAEMKRLDKAYATGELSIENCYLSKSQPIDMGYTDSSNLDDEIYK